MRRVMWRESQLMPRRHWLRRCKVVVKKDMIQQIMTRVSYHQSWRRLVLEYGRLVWRRAPADFFMTRVTWAEQTQGVMNVTSSTIVPVTRCTMTSVTLTLVSMTRLCHCDDFRLSILWPWLLFRDSVYSNPVQRLRSPWLCLSQWS